MVHNARSKVYERLLRKLLHLPNRPAVVLMQVRAILPPSSARLLPRLPLARLPTLPLTQPLTRLLRLLLHLLLHLLLPARRSPRTVTPCGARSRRSST
jgi:hypothetical protein